MAIAKDQPEIIFRSKLPDIEIPTDRFPLHAYCFENLPKFSNRPCLINATSGHVYTYSDVDLNAKKVASGLHTLGIRKGDVIMLLLHNSPEFMFAFLGASHIGAITTTANPLYLPDDIANQARASNSKLIITESKYVEKLNNLGDEVKIICTDSAPEKCLPFSELLQSDEIDMPEVKIDQNDTVGLLYSSGTTGLPKAVMLTHKGLITSIAQHVDGENPNLYYNHEDVIMCVLPLLHLYSLCSVMLSGLRAGSAMVIVQRFEIGAFLEVVDKYKVSVLPSVPPILAAIADCALTKNYDLSPVRMVISAATPLGRKLEDAVKAKLPNATIGQVYGMTEASVLTICMSLAKEPGVSKLGSCGNVVRNAEVKIVDPNTKASLPRNQRGEICVRSNQLAKGYLNNPKATEETIDKEGWLHTGDIGYIDDDGELFVVDRIKELIKYKGFQVAPAELETMLLAHSNISDAAVVSMKDEIAGEIPVAFVVRANGTIILEEDIKKYIAKQVIFYKRIHRVFFVDKIPKASSGKILRNELRQKLVATSLS